MQPDQVTVIIPLLRGQEWNEKRATCFRDGTRYMVVAYDEPAEYADAVNVGVNAAKTDLVILSDPDVWFASSDEEGEAVEFLTDLAWDCDVTYGKQVVHVDGNPVYLQGEGFYCGNRLQRENYIPPTACFRKKTLIEAGGYQTGAWELYNRLREHDARFKYVPEAVSARDGMYNDPSPKPAEPTTLATFYHQATPGTTYWRCALPARYLPGQVVFNIPLMGPDADNKVEFRNHAGAAVFQFAGDSAHHAIVRAMQEQGIRVLIEADDDYAGYHRYQQLKAGWTERIQPGGGYSVEGHLETVKIADGVIVTTERLAKQYRKHNPNVFVCPNQIDPDDWPEPEKPDDGILRIGWFASGSHGDDAHLIDRALTWAAAQPNVQVQMIGVGGTASGKPRYNFPYMWVPWSNDLGVYKRFLGAWDIGLSPVKGTPWALCRSDLKALEYGMAGALPVCSDVAPYDTVDVPKAKTEKDFLNVVRSLVRDPDGTRQKAKEWRDYVLKHRTFEKNISTWRDAVA